MIHVIATIELHPGARAAFVKAFHELMPKVHAEPGCLEYGPTVDVETSIAAQGPLRPDTVVIVEKWESLEALEAHLMASHMMEYRLVVKPLVKGSTLLVLEPV